MPCLNEAETLAVCIQKAQHGLEQCGLTGEILVADNGSTDGSIAIAERAGARVVHVKDRGYGAALQGGAAAARGRWVLMGDADDSYDFSAIEPFVAKLQAGFVLVMGCRLPRGGGRIMPGAMPWKHRWIGNPVLSFIGRLFFAAPVTDFHCGLRAFGKDAFQRLGLRTTGMEFASEMVVKATLSGLRISEVPITLHKDGRSRPPHLRSWRDGWRHLRFMLLFSPRWLFLLPGIGLAVAGFAGVSALAAGPLQFGAVVLDAGTQAMTAMFLLIGCQLVWFALFTKVFAIAEGILPDDPRFSRVFRHMSLEKGLAVGAVLSLAGFLLAADTWLAWRSAGFGHVPYSENLRRLIPASTLLTLGAQVFFSSLFMSVLGLKTSTRTPPNPDVAAGR
jgi:hypothetical protein